MNIYPVVASKAGKIYRSLGRGLSARRLGSRVQPGDKLHLGCGPNRFEGWVNIDRSGSPDLRHDLRWGLPLPPHAVRFIYSEHVFEHLLLTDTIGLLNDCRTALEPGGVMRIAMPDLGYLVDRYKTDWKGQAWIQDPVYSDIDTAAHMLNHALRSWGHLYVYDAEDLTQRLLDAGFRDVTRRPWGDSPHAELKGLETREDSKLIVEATAP